MSRITHITDPDAQDIYVDDTNLSFETEDVQDALEKLDAKASVSASPGFTWGKSGAVPAGTYLLNDSVPSNVSGRPVPISNGYIKEVFVAVKTAGTFHISVEKRTGALFTELLYVTLSGVRIDSFPVSVAVAYKDELAVRVRSTSPSNPADPVVGLIIRGETA